MTISLVQSKTGYASATSVTLTFDSTATANNLLIAFVNQRYGNNTYSTPSGWTLLDSAKGTNAAAYPSTAAFYKIADGTETSVTLTSSYNYEQCALFVEYSGLATSSVLDAQAENTSYLSSDAPTNTDITTSNLTPTSAPGLAVALAACEETASNNSVSVGSTSGFTEVIEFSQNTTYDPIVWLATKEYSDTSAITPGVRISVTGNVWLVGALFKAPVVERNVSHLLCLGVG